MAEELRAQMTIAGQGTSELIKGFEKDEKYKKARGMLIDILKTVKLQYHGLQHALYVEKNALELAVAEGVPKKLLPIMSLAAVGHDTGFSVSYPSNEPYGAKITVAVMESVGYKPWAARLANDLIIHGTPFPQKPRNKLQMILADSDLANLGTDSYIPLGMLLKEEWRTQGLLKPEMRDPLGWSRHQLAFLEMHTTFFTTAARMRFGPKQEENKQAIRREIDVLQAAERPHAD